MLLLFLFFLLLLPNPLKLQLVLVLRFACLYRLRHHLLARASLVLRIEITHGLFFQLLLRQLHLFKVFFALGEIYLLVLDVVVKLKTSFVVVFLLFFDSSSLPFLFFIVKLSPLLCLELFDFLLLFELLGFLIFLQHSQSKTFAHVFDQELDRLVRVLHVDWIK